MDCVLVMKGQSKTPTNFMVCTLTINCKSFSLFTLKYVILERKDKFTSDILDCSMLLLFDGP